MNYIYLLQILFSVSLLYLFDNIKILKYNEKIIFEKYSLIQRIINEILDDKKDIENDNELFKYNIKINYNGNSKFYKYIEKEIFKINKYKKELSRNSYGKEIDIKYIIEYIINQDNINIKERWRIRNKFNRFIYLYDLYNEKLKYIDFSITKITKAKNSDWLKIKQQLDVIINKI